jgi:hypothetical protein
MRKPTTGETIGTIAGLGVGAVLGGVVVRGFAEDRPAEGSVLVPLAAMITHTENREGKPIGVRTFASPLTSQERGNRADAASVDVVCIEPNGRKLIDTDVPAGAPTDRGNDWYLLTATTDRSRQEWVNTSYVEITHAAGAAALAECATVPGFNPRG